MLMVMVWMVVVCGLNMRVVTVMRMVVVCFNGKDADDEGGDYGDGLGDDEGEDEGDEGDDEGNDEGAFTDCASTAVGSRSGTVARSPSWHRSTLLRTGNAASQSRWRGITRGCSHTLRQYSCPTRITHARTRVENTHARTQTQHPNP